MAGHANFFRRNNTIKKASNVQNNKPNAGVNKPITCYFKSFKSFLKYCIRCPVRWMQ
jgi:hypothetical protein